MHLKSLTLRGFKSFASATTLRFEPGVTCVVGPNGSGKSNVVDALSWVMGEQGAKSLRGGTMADVIFAGTAGRPALGRAEVTLTIDNSDGALPVDYTEVTISRTMFRSGGSEYAINNSPCRLLDIQELLSDSGIGREMHVIVGQGQLDAVLHASPEERRGFIEEAAGVLKHRKRKEKALRKLDAMQANLTRLGDLTTEIRRQLKPLGRQAEVARRAQTVQADLRDAKARLLADDLAQLTSALAADVADEAASRARKDEVEADFLRVRTQLTDLERIAAEAAPQLARAQETWYRLSSLRERIRGSVTLAAERRRLLSEDVTERVPGRDPEELEAQARAVREQEQSLQGDLEIAREVLETAVEARHEAEAAEGEEVRRVQSLMRAAADRREGLARLAGKAAASRSRLEAGQEETQRLVEAAAEVEQRSRTARDELAVLRERADENERTAEELTQTHQLVLAELAGAEDDLERRRQEIREAEQEHATWTARREALELGLRRKDGTAAVLAATDRLSGVLGSVAAMVQVEPGYENAVAAALGAAADAVLVENPTDADAAVRLLKADDAGRAMFVVAGPGTADRPGTTLPPGSRWVRDLVRTPPSIVGALDRLVRHAVVVTDLESARALIAAYPQLTAVTYDGDVVQTGSVRGGSAAAPTLLEVQAAVDEAADRITAATRRADQAGAAVEQARQRRDTAAQAVQHAAERLEGARAQATAASRELAQTEATVRAAQGEVDRYTTALAEKQVALEADRAALADVEERLRSAEQNPDQDEPSTEERDRRAVAATAARSAEMEARLALRTAEERARALSGRAESLERAAAGERQARSRAAEREARRHRQVRTAEAVRLGAEYVLGLLERSLEAAEEERRASERERQDRDEHLTASRDGLRELTEELSRLTDSVHRDEVARAEQRLRIEALRQRSVEELGLDPDILIEEYGPHQPVPTGQDAPEDGPADDPDQAPRTEPYVRARQEKRLRAAERALALLGKVNPLALEEFAALEERHRFLTEQLEDLRSSRKDLLDIVRDIDTRVERVFAEAFQDTAREFEGVFSTLFPGGQGRLVLTDPSDLLTSGLEVEARPPGKKVKRLSLLSGGERSLTAVALLVAIFKARPSPFYVLDEVEAALDDTNLGRLISLLAELRESSQLIVITHQKRTMEIADALYGVSMRGDGVTTVVSQRLREEQPA